MMSRPQRIEYANEEIRSFFEKERLSPILGNDAFIRDLDHLNQSKEIPLWIDCLTIILNIIEETAKEFSQRIELITITQKGRGSKNITRKIAMYIAKKLYDYRLNEIARAFGLKHYGLLQMHFTLSTELVKYPELELKLNAIIKRLDPNF